MIALRPDPLIEQQIRALLPASHQTRPTRLDLLRRNHNLLSRDCRDQLVVKVEPLFRILSADCDRVVAPGCRDAVMVDDWMSAKLELRLP